MSVSLLSFNYGIHFCQIYSAWGKLSVGFSGDDDKIIVVIFMNYNLNFRAGKLDEEKRAVYVFFFWSFAGKEVSVPEVLLHR